MQPLSRIIDENHDTLKLSQPSRALAAGAEIGYNGDTVHQTHGRRQMHCLTNLAIPLTVLSALVHGTRANEMVFPGKQWETATPESQLVGYEGLH